MGNANRFRWRCCAALLAAALLWGCGDEAPDASEGSEAADASVRSPGDRPEWVERGEDEEPSYWLLSEFDWGDEREVVFESTQFDPWYTCHQNKKFQGICALAQVDVEGELLMARFHFDGPGLFEMAFLTPDLDPDQARKHLPRVWKGLADYATLHLGEPVSASEMPDLDTLAVGELPVETHLWQAAGVDARLMVGRSAEDRFFTVLYFFDPEKRALHEQRLAEPPEKREGPLQRRLRQQGLEMPELPGS